MIITGVRKVSVTIAPGVASGGDFRVTFVTLGEVQNFFKSLIKF